MQKVNQATKMK